MREDLIYGIHVIESLLKHKPEQMVELYIVNTREDERIKAIVAQAKQQSLIVSTVFKKQLDKWLPNTAHQGVAAKIRLISLLSLEDILQKLEETKERPFFLILDGIQDPHNLGACLRTADAAGVSAVIIPKDRSASITPAVRKAASGAAETVPIIQVTNLVRCLEQLKASGIWITGTSGSASSSLYQTDLRGPIGIVLGAEGTGLRRLTEEHCDVLMHIPMLGLVESLNVSVAAGVCLYEAVRQRNVKP